MGMSFLWIYRKQDYLKMGAAALERLQKKEKKDIWKKTLALIQEVAELFLKKIINAIFL